MEKLNNKDIEFECMGANYKDPKDYFFSYENKDFSYKGELKNYNYANLLKQKQANIYKFMELASYYVDADDIFSGLIKRVLTPFSMTSGYTLSGGERIIKKYKDFHAATGFKDVLRCIFFELYTFGNCYIYIMDDGHLITLPPHRIKISDLMKKGEPILEFNIMELNNIKSNVVEESFIKTLEKKYEGYPREIKESLKRNASAWVQLNPDRTLVVQESKPMWEKYAIPFISTCLKPLAKKELISYYEDTLLNMGAKGFLHVKVGDKDILPAPNGNQLNEVVSIFKRALNKYPLAVTNWLTDAKFITMEQEDLFDNSKYSEVNKQILSAGGISTVIVTGDSSNDSFASVNMSIETAAKRIGQNQDNVAEAINKYHYRLNNLWNGVIKNIPEFKFNNLNLTNSNELKSEAFTLWQSGSLSRKTMLEKHDYNYDQEKERKEKEKDDEKVFTIPVNPHTSSGDNNNDDSTGRPTKNTKDLKRDKNQSDTGKQPKPSNK